MSTSNTRIQTLVLLLASVVGPLPGSVVGQEGELERYEVELIVFRHLDSSRSTSETDPPARPLFSGPDADSLEDEREATMAQAAPTVYREGRNDSPRFTPLSSDRLQLSRTYQRLQQIDAYAPILHAGWTQEARSTNEAVPNRLGRGGRPGGESRLAGSVTLYKQRFLHLNIDLALEPLDTRRALGGRVFGDIPSSTGPGRPSMRLQESRRIRNEDLNYFDHPELGVIVTVREIATNVAVPKDPATDP